ncbi:Pregnancy-associated plasma protein-A [Nonlabens sp. Hel1_33_55]|uniref:zinc metalloprotease n=1 Tax=Nonlabens sp. Hel1_33_55 TaxID=1336802 RepID=UPI000875DC2A|nr:zinc metalloprotease [Nonlabens sp. Hel1_33_55]SCY27236.1 Pregnancy-associated plasma protein-A [Nonlabens sp. Hel1_33_55]
MKKVILSLFATALILSCSENSEFQEDPINNDGIQTAELRKCYAAENFDKMMLNPEFALNAAAIEAKANQFAQAAFEKARKKPRGGGNDGGDTGGTDPGDNIGVVNIPVIVHVLYNNNSENISDAQINSQIAVLNNDFRKTNSDAGSVPSEFAGLAADSEITFTLSSITRTSSTRTSWGTNDAMKSSANGGVDAVDPANNLNIWVCNIGGGILGYAQFPGGPASTDGVVVAPQYFGTIGSATAPFDGGRTATHEVGHYLNLRHIWGDGRCNRDDFVADTPSSDRANYGCPSYPTSHCRSNDMTMNYMDYVNDDCMYMFSAGQKTRMRSLFAAGGARESLIK